MDFTAQILNLSKRNRTLRTLSLFTIGSAIILGLSLFILTSKQGQSNMIQFALLVKNFKKFPFPRNLLSLGMFNRGKCQENVLDRKDSILVSYCLPRKCVFFFWQYFYIHAQVASFVLITVCRVSRFRSGS
jgi:hypothetical protein